MLKSLLIIAALLLSSSLAQSQDPAPEAPSADPPVVAPSDLRFSIGGVLGANLGVQSTGVTSGAVSFTLKFSGALGPEEAPSASFVANLRSSVDAATGNPRVALGETVLTAYLGSVDLSAGNLLVNWGAVDLFGVVSHFNPQDLSTRERLPVPAVRATWVISDALQLEGVIAPGFTPSLLPTMLSAMPAPGMPPPGVTIVGQDAPVDNRPASRFENTQYGLRFTADLPLFDGGDVSASVYGGPRHTPTVFLRLNPTSQPGQFTAQAILNYDWIHVFGLETNLLIGGVAVRGEAAYTLTQDPDGTNPMIGNPSLEGTLQADFTLSNINFNALLNARSVRGEGGNANAFGVNAALIAGYELDTRTTVSAVWVQSVTDGSGIILPNLSYTVADGFKFEASAGLNYGGVGSSLNPAGTVLFQVRLGLKLSF
jgi:hypothetical protein